MDSNELIHYKAKHLVALLKELPELEEAYIVVAHSAMQSPSGYATLPVEAVEVWNSETDKPLLILFPSETEEATPIPADRPH